MAREIWVADSETDPFKAGRIPAPFVWGAYNGSEYHQFEDTDQFVDFFEDKKAIVYAHNGGKFDWHFILHRFEQFSEIQVISGRLAKFRIGECEFRDSFNILPFSLATYQKDEIDYSIFEREVRNMPENWEKITAYLKSDCVYLYEMVSAFIDRYGMHLTVAGAALKTWEKIAETKAPKTGAFFYESFSPYYYGGRVECFESGVINTDFEVIDINSAYPYAMKSYHPYGDNYDVSTSLPNTKASIQRAFIKLECVASGCFPFRSDTGLTFPNDSERRVYNITGWEFLAAIDTGTIQDWEILEVITFNDSIVFTDYIDHFFDLKTTAKQNGDKAGYLFSKLFLTSLYGKFGANPDNYTEYTIVKPRYIDAAEADGYNFTAELGPWALCSRPLMEEKRRYYNVAVAASITGFVRAYLWRAINECEGVMYCDTDSIACRRSGALELDPERLGAWDVEAQCDFAAIAGKKLYAFRLTDGTGWKTASKGVRLEPEEIISVAKGVPTTYNPENPSFSLKRGNKFISRKITKNA